MRDTDPTPAITQPTEAMLKWFRLAADYERARLGNDITKQTELALCRVVEFLEQPAQAYDPAARIIGGEQNDGRK